MSCTTVTHHGLVVGSFDDPVQAKAGRSSGCHRSAAGRGMRASVWERVWEEIHSEPERSYIPHMKEQNVCKTAQ